jgi:SAM-dependent methyltransferase
MSHADDYYANYGGLTVSDYVDRHIRGSAVEMERIRRTVGLVPPSAASVLDVGAGHGTFLEELKLARGIPGVGIEITPAKVDYARSIGVDLRLGDAAALAFDDRSFDAVVSCEVMEHLPFGVFEAAARELGRVAREWVIVTVPFDERRRFVACPYCSARVNPDYHFRAFAPGSLEGLIPGFRLDQSLHLGWQRQPVGVQIGRRLFGRWPRFLVCPCCGYKAAIPELAADNSADASSATGPTVTGSAHWARRIANWLPASGRPIWLVGVFRRDNGTGAGHA